MSKSKLFLRKMYNIKRATAIAKMFAYFRQIFMECVLNKERKKKITCLF